MVYFISFLLGCVTFIVSQLFLRLPLLQAFLLTASGSAWLLAYPVFGPALVGFTAGIFEEPARWLALRFYTAGKTRDVLAAGLLGLGHGLVEALWLYVTSLRGNPFAAMLPALIERVIAIAIHVALSILIFRGIKAGKSGFALLGAVVIHGLINFLIPVIQNVGGDTGLFIYLVVIAMLAILYITLSLGRRMYETETR